MKRIIAIIGLLGFTGSLFAATVNQPIPSPISVLTPAQILASTPTYSGQLVVCNGCTAANQPSGGFNICIGTETSTAANGYVLVSSAAAVTACK